jgi:hypothetical protein
LRDLVFVRDLVFAGGLGLVGDPIRSRVFIVMMRFAVGRLRLGGLVPAFFV